MANAINWFEIPTSDFERAKKFYEAVLAAEIPVQQMGPAMMGFFPYDGEGGVSGAIVHCEGHEPCHKGVMIYLNGGDDLSEMLSRVETAGGNIVQEKTQITPDIGYMATFSDTEGNKISIHSSN